MERARKTRVQLSKGELCPHSLQTWFWPQHAYLENKGKLNIPADRPIESDQDEETDLEEPYDDIEIVEQTALDHFNAVLMKAQRLAVKAEKNNP